LEEKRLEKSKESDGRRRGIRKKKRV